MLSLYLCVGYLPQLGCLFEGDICGHSSGRQALRWGQEGWPWEIGRDKGSVWDARGPGHSAGLACGMSALRTAPHGSTRLRTAPHGSARHNETGEADQKTCRTRLQLKKTWIIFVYLFVFLFA